MQPNRTPIAERARGRWKEILPAMGVEASFLSGRHGPCPMCGGRDRWRYDDKGGAGTWICSHCGAGNGFALVMMMKGCVFADAARMIEEVIGTDSQPVAPKTETDNRAKSTRKRMEELWKSSVRVSQGDPVWRYLRARVGEIEIPETLRYVPECWHPETRRTYPAMLARVRDPFGDSVALHRTYLTVDGRKAQVEPVRMALGNMPDGCAVRLGDYGRLLGIAEGIETALAASLMHNMPVWAALNANRLKVWSPPEGVTEVIVFGDNDLNCVGQSASFALAERLNQSIIAQVAIPPDPGTDWNDVLVAKRQAA